MPGWRWWWGPWRVSAGGHALAGTGAGRLGGYLALQGAGIWSVFGLQVWRTGTFTVFSGPPLTGKIRDVAVNQDIATWL